MADVIPMARARATRSVVPDDSPETLRLHGLAENALATALHLLRKPCTTQAQLQQATARAVRAATLLKRASQANGGEVQP